MRRAFVEALTQAAEQDPRVVFLTGDLGYGVFDDFVARFGPRYINAGVAEAQLVNAAAGLAREGFRPLAYSIASFMTGRPFEQIRFSIGYPSLPVILVGAGGGYCYSSSGVSHHAPDDFALMGLVPGMTVVAPGDPNEVRALLPQLLELPGPSYIRIGKFGEPTYDAESPVKLGHARLLRKGERIAVLTTGEMAPLALDALPALAKEGIAPIICQFHTIKPLDTAALKTLATRVHTLIIVEEAAPSGALFSGIRDWKQATGCDVRLIRLGPSEDFVLGNPHRETLRRTAGFDTRAIIETCRAEWPFSRPP
ncbi:MAG: transketolase C-terminal domain-containing protein [bacterium]